MARRERQFENGTRRTPKTVETLCGLMVTFRSSDGDPLVTKLLVLDMSRDHKELPDQCDLLHDLLDEGTIHHATADRSERFNYIIVIHMIS